MKFNVLILRNIDKHANFVVNKVTPITRHNENVYPVRLCLLSELPILKGFDKIDSSKYVIQFLVN